MNIFKRILKPPKYSTQLAIFEPIHPKFPIGGFRHAEHSYYFENLAEVVCVHGHSYEPKTKKDMQRTIRQYCQGMGKPEWVKRFYMLDQIKHLEPELGYSLMINFTLQFLPTFERFNIPFCICVTPGGGFEIDNAKSDAKYYKIIESPSFRYLIATQEIIHDYLLNKFPSLKGKSEVIYGGFSQIELIEVPHREDVCKKRQLDIAFIAYNYGNNGFDKGFDIFCNIVTYFTNQTNSKFRFHIVGNWNYSVIDFAPQPSENVIYHGVLDKKDLLALYAEIDIIVNPYRLLESGSFNGFPMSPDGSMCGVALFTTNPLKLKTPYVSGQDVVEISTVPSEIIQDLAFYEKERNSLKLLAERGQQKTCQFRSRKVQCEARIRVFEKLLGHQLTRI